METVVSPPVKRVANELAPEDLQFEVVPIHHSNGQYTY